MMNFNKAIAVSVLMVGISTVPAYAADNDAGSVHVQGTFVDSSCLIAQNELDKQIDFGDFAKSTVSAVAQDGVVFSKPLTFNITNCPAITNSVGIKFDFDQVDFGKNYIKNTGMGKGAVFGISSGLDTNAIPTGSKIETTAFNEQTATINAQVNIYRTAENYTVGDLKSTANVTLVYN
ncbi:fimbrial protein [Serratia quinivorans]|uniref:Type 1 fimbrial protein n=1 Tax=Serratia proteamaculans TaxID=28151 RepID=A0ABS0TUL4_SERPR|nr:MULTISPECIES: fimbrial protein [Serratia]MBI6182057.1 type 1 fimbrial protein [Serratia proteamaculans]CAI1016966.1 fimbrial protein [Serratia quinivorans]CAI1058004.1 fimbrial protein [Serratia quinivorans]CAI1240472.1 fimbrial protein [Serratia quinivorans]CAI2024040.1 fimbrial protein [Serratia quinivorans]